MKTSVLIFFLACCALWQDVQAKDERDSSTLVEIGQQVPDFTFVNENGEQESIGDYLGKLVLVNFFATWCGPCMQELPQVQTDIFEKYKDNKDFVLLVVGREHSNSEMKKFKANKGFTFKLVADPQREIYSKFAEQFIPRNFLIDKDGKIIYSSIGFNEGDFSTLKETIANKLHEAE